MMISPATLEVRHVEVPGNRRPLVFLHEGLGCVDMWNSRTLDWPLAVCQATGRSGWVYSRRGYGRSPALADVRGANRLLPDYMHQEAWEVLPRLLNTYALENPVLLGHSDGATIALLHAAKYSVAATIAMAPHLWVEDISLRSIEAAKAAFEHGELRRKLARFHDDVDGAFWQWNDVWLSDAFRSFEIRPECRQITSPVLAMQGVDDIYGSLRHIEELHTQGTVRTEVLQNCGHSPHKDQPQVSLDLIADFLKDLP